MNTVKLDEVLQKIYNLPSLPSVVLELLESIDQEDIKVDSLAKKIAQDQALTAKTLRLANSSFYGMSNQVNTIHEAIAILGFRTVRTLVTTAALLDTFSGRMHAGFNAAPFWRHALATAICARELAVQLNSNPERAYTAGLLHDIGRLVLVTQFQAKYLATMAYRDQHDCGLLDAEKAVLGLDHAAIGHALTNHWKFPASVQLAIASHHSTTSMGLPTLSTVVVAADAITHALDLSRDKNDLVPHICTGLWKQLGLEEKALFDVFSSTEKQFQAASLVLTA